VNTEIAACPFCAIASGDERADIVYEDDAVVCFLPLTLNAYGHTLIVPRAHCETLWDIERQVAAKLMAVVHQLSLEYRSSLGATGFNLLHASGRDAQQSVAHFHLHLLPRFADDDLDAWPPLPTVQVNRSELLEQLRRSRG
jgi:histidine triad (HIT) family protein